MKENVGKLSLALLVLVGVWITVYTVWQPEEPPITFGSNPVREPAIPPVPEGEANPPSDDVPEQPEPAAPARDSPPRTGAVIAPQFAQYTVRSGDTLQTISKQYYGTSAHAGAIGRANPFMDPSRLRPGRVIRIPRDPANIQGRPQQPQADTQATAPRPARMHVVRAGDTLSGISKEYYGTTGRADRIFEANRDKLKHPNDLRIGIELMIPDVEKNEAESTGAGDR